jgi:hypothetical protein
MRPPFGLSIAPVLAVAVSVHADVVLSNNGPVVNLPGGGSGGAHASRVQGELGLTELGFGTLQSTPSNTTWIELADDFTITTPGGWRIKSVTVFTLPPAFTGGTTCLSNGGSVNHASVRVSSAAGAGPAQFFGPLTPLTTGVYRVPAGDPSYTGCPILAARVNVDVTLAPGSYWITWALDTSNGSALGFTPPVVPVTRAGQAGTGNAMSRVWTCDILTGMCTPGGWSALTDGGFGQDIAFEIRGTPEGAVKGNLDGQRAADLLFRNTDPASPHFNRVKVWSMDGTARTGETFITPDPPGPSWSVAGADDFDSWSGPGLGPDGQSDLVLRDAATGQVAFWLMNGTNRVGAPVPLGGAPPLPLEWQLTATGDFNADGLPDLLWRNTTTLKLLVWTLNRTNKTGEIVPLPDQAAHFNWETVAALDYNLDGARDLLWYNTTTGKIVLWFMTASVQRLAGQFVNPPNAGNANWKVLASSDYSATQVPGTPPMHSPDIVWRNVTSGNQVIWHLNNAGDRLFGEFTNPSANPQPLSWTIVGPR